MVALSLRAPHRRRADVQQLAERHERHEISAQLRHAVRAKQIVDSGPRWMQAFDDRRHRDDVGLRSDPDDHSIHHGERQWQCKLDRHAPATLRLERNASAHVLNVASNDIHADAAAGNVGDLFSGAIAPTSAPN
jgi:hypothetical protein